MSPYSFSSSSLYLAIDSTWYRCHRTCVLLTTYFTHIHMHTVRVIVYKHSLNATYLTQYSMMDKT